MSNSTLTVRVRPHPEADIVTTLLTYKELPHQVLADPPSDGLPVEFTDRQVTLTSTVAIIDYLCERWPCPGFYPEDPAARAVYRQALFQLQRSFYRAPPCTPDAIATFVRRVRLPPDGFYHGPAPGVLDILILPVARRCRDHALVTAYCDRLERALCSSSSSSSS